MPLPARAAPRAGFEWTPDVGKTVVRQTWAAFYDSVPLDVYAFSGYPEQTITTYNSSGVPVGQRVEYINLTRGGSAIALSVYR